MMNRLSNIALALTLLWSAPTFAENTLPMHEITKLESGHLFMLGTGVLVGATLIAPSLKIGELMGVLIGAVASELTYRSVRNSNYWPFKESNEWFKFY